MVERTFPEESLSPRQLQVLRLAGDGLTDQEICLKLGISPGTVRTHWDRIRGRTATRSRSEALAHVGRSLLEKMAFERDSLLALLDSMPILAWTARPDGEVDYCNRALIEFAELDLQELLGMGCRALMREEDLIQSAERWSNAQDSKKPYQAEVLLRDRPHKLQLTPVICADGRPERWVGWAYAL